MFFDNKIDSSKYENKSYSKIFPTDESFIELPISEYANLGDGVGYMFNIWFADGTKIRETGKVSYLNENNRAKKEGLNLSSSQFPCSIFPFL